jgi:hypothetical protein
MDKRTELTAILAGIATGPTRTVYSFINPDDPEHPKKVSAFPPKELGQADLPDVKIGKTYKLIVIDKPAGEGKFYHNIAQNGRNGPYLIAEVFKPGEDMAPVPPKNAEKFAKALEPDEVYEICENSLKDTLELHKAYQIPSDMLGTIFGTLAIERFRRSRQ